MRYRPITKAALQRWPLLNRLGYRFWQTYIENSLGRATVERCWQRRLMSPKGRRNLRLSVRNPELRRKLTPWRPSRHRELLQVPDVADFEVRTG